MKNLKSSISLLTVSLLTVPMFLFGAEAAASKQLPPPKADVYVVPKPYDLKVDLKYPAQIKSFKTVEVYSRVLGVLEEKYFNEGELVKKGTTLFKIEDALYQAKVDASLASVKMGEATLVNAKRNWERINKLYETKAVTIDTRDNALTTYENAISSLALAKAQLKQAQIDLDYTKVKAPISGVAGIKAVDLGDLVSNNPPSQLLTITQNDKLYIDFSMPLSDYSNIQSGLWSISADKKIGVDVIVNGKASGVTGYVDFIDVNIDEKTSTVKMRAIVDNKDNKVMPGSFIRVGLSGIVQKNVITIPQKALLQNPMGTIVMIEENGKAAVRPVIPGKESGSNYIVAGGMVKSGDRVIVNNFFRVKPGNPVTVDKVINE